MVHTRANSDTEEDRDEDGMIYTSSPGASTSTRTHRPNHHYLQGSSSPSLRARLFGFGSSTNLRSRDRQICTTPGQVCAGETETETDEPSRHLPTARKIPTSAPLVPPNTLQQRFTPLLFEFSRLLSIVPALIGTIYYLSYLYKPPEKGVNWDDPIRPPPERIDYFVTILWALLTGYQCLALTTGLLTRWRLYYAPLSTLVRLLALQGICWPATSITLSFFDHDKRPVATWAAIATTTSISRSVQIWVTSNLWWDANRTEGDVPWPDGIPPGGSTAPSRTASALDFGAGVSLNTTESHRRAFSKRTGHSGGGKKRRLSTWSAWVAALLLGGLRWGGRRWDWKAVGVKCVLPVGVLYFVTAWAELIRREMEMSRLSAAGIVGS